MYHQSIYNIYSKPKNSLNLKYILAIINSRLLNYYFYKKIITNADVFPYIKGIHLQNLPVKKIESEKQEAYISIVEKILLLTAEDNYLNDSRKQLQVKKYEEAIDNLVYQLYGLTEGEIKIVEEGRIS